MPNKEDRTDQELIEALRRRGRADLKKELLVREEKLEPITPSATVHRFALWKIAAILLPLLAVAAWLLLGQSPSHQQLATNNAFPYPNVATTPIVRGPEAPAPRTLREALADYEAGRYAAATTALTTLPPTDTTAFYLAVIAANEGDWIETDQQLATVPANSTFSLAADYFRALSLLNAEQPERAKALLLPSEKWADYPGLARRVDGILLEL